MANKGIIVIAAHFYDNNRIYNEVIIKLFCRCKPIKIEFDKFSEKYTIYCVSDEFDKHIEGTQIQQYGFSYEDETKKLKIYKA